MSTPVSSPSSTPTAQLTIRATHAGAFVVAAFWATAGLLVASLNQLAWSVFAFMFGSGTILFIVIGSYYRSNILSVFPDTLYLSSWFSERRIALKSLASFSLRTTLLGRSLQHTIICWDATGQELGTLPIRPFRKQQIAQALATVQQAHPDITIDRELERFLQTQ